MLAEFEARWACKDTDKVGGVLFVSPKLLRNRMSLLVFFFFFELPVSRKYIVE